MLQHYSDAVFFLKKLTFISISSDLGVNVSLVLAVVNYEALNLYSTLFCPSPFPQYDGPHKRLR